MTDLDTLLTELRADGKMVHEMAPRAVTPGPWPNLGGGPTVSQSTCTVPECDRRHLARGWCGMHYQRWVVHGTAAYELPTTAERFERFFTKGDGCWEWQGANSGPTRGYYGAFKDGVADKQVPAHRYSYELYVGPIPAGFHVDHLCRNPPCVNPAHLEAVTPRENNLRSNSRSSLNSRKTHCQRGHPLTGANLITRMYRGRLARNCRACLRIWHAAHDRKLA